MKNLISAILTTGLMTSTIAFADTVQTMKGTGIDGQSCAVQIVRDGNNLKSVTLVGASQVYEILSESSESTGSHSNINPYGGKEIFDIAENGDRDVYGYFSYSKNLFSNGEVFKLDTSDLPDNGQDELRGVKMLIQLDLEYDRKELVKVKAETKVKALLFATLASSEFTCEK